MSFRYLTKVLPYYLIVSGILSISIGINVIQYHTIQTQSNMINRMLKHISYMSLANYDLYKNRR